jgi:cytochrome c oxidase subunit 2
MARLAALFFWFLALGTAFAFISRSWLPELASAHGADVDRELHLTLAIAGAAFVLAHIVLGIMIWRFPARKSGPANYWHESRGMEISWTLVTAAIFIGLGLQGSRIWARTYLTEPPSNSLAIEVTGQQFAWHVRYPGPDGKFGRTRPDKVDDTEGNYIGLDDADPAAADDITADNVVAVPVNRPVKLTLRSRDVVHSFFVPVLRVKQDAVPGMTIPIQFTATKVGAYDLVCAELCGLLHYEMHAKFLVMTDADFSAWLKSKAAQ